MRVAPFRFCGLAVVAVALAGCMHVPMSTIAKLWSFDMATADPAVIRAAMRVPEALRARPGGVRLDITTGAQGTDGYQKRSFVLQEVHEPGELYRLAAFRRAGFHLAAFRLSPRDVEEIRQLQAAARNEAQRTGRRAKGNLGISAEACREGLLPAGAIRSSTYLLVDVQQGYLTVIDDIDLRQEIGSAALMSQVPPCDTTGR